MPVKSGAAVEELCSIMATLLIEAGVNVGYHLGQ
jgi:hypothetical protein